MCLCYIILLLIIQHDSSYWNSDLFACADEEAKDPGEQVYLGRHMQGQGLLTDMISLAHGKGTHYPKTAWSSLPYLSNWNNQ